LKRWQAPFQDLGLQIANELILIRRYVDLCYPAPHKESVRKRLPEPEAGAFLW
jgi:hypothetical protein